MGWRNFLSFMILIPVFLILITHTSHEMKKPATFYRSTWIWNPFLIQTEPHQILSFSKKEGIKEIYLQINQELPQKRYMDFIEQAHKEDIRVFALGGEPTWGLESEIQIPLQFLKWIEEYNVGVNQEQQFDGIQFDIEPYLLPNWSSNQSQIISQWMSVLSQFVEEAHKAELQVSGVLPFWLDQISINHPRQTLSEWIINRFDHIVVMAYRDQAEGPNGILAISKTEVSYANSIGKPIMIAIETMDTPEGKHLTFFHKGLEKMEMELEKVMINFQSYPYFKGIAVHHYETYQDLRP
ncbi:hypothetical protein [Neobacillus sp. D3-1R]|uniref:hypothetical protein n=1 Tax=Neobacillus sp. D3-1R TaxID=3445778 RepID=UPI003F9FCCE9